MKKNATPTLQGRWWLKELPEGLKAAKPLAQALDALEAADGKAETGDAKGLAVATKALEAVEDRMAALRKEVEQQFKAAGKSPAAEPLQNTLAALTAATRLLSGTRESLLKRGKAAPAAATGKPDSDNEEEITGLADPVAYQAQLKAGLMRLKRGPMQFAVGLAKTAADHRFLVHPRQTGRALAKLIQKDSEATRMTWGQAFADPEQPTRIVLVIESKVLSGLRKQLELVLKLNKPLPYTTVRIQLDGQDVDDEAQEFADADGQEESTPAQPLKPPPTPPIEGLALRQEMQALGPGLKALIAQKPAMADTIGKSVAQFDAALKGTQWDTARSILAALRKATGNSAALSGGAAKPHPQASTAAPAPSSGGRGPTGAVNYAKARLAWLAARQKVHGELDQLRTEIRDTFADEDEPTFPDLENRLTGLDAILATLDESLADTLDAALNAGQDEARRSEHHRQAQAQIADFLAYVDADPLLSAIDANPFVPVTVHALLQSTLKALSQALRT